ncbi:bifunctional methylenetetrahydrofolate dehydrogenase/methenyltetrahydrofolate cyclohydrolase FolD [Acidiphilium sp.]|uniref:bifunctional methylenetetrahydrofolate dehydrogenase/methenyltetrahydrofolate cyclohydrolase FolD n=1 Tax=Acidiphilium sp. TaxID=527 RepID=UPI003D086C38
MTATLIDGKAIAATLRASVAARAALLAYRPGLVVVLVGEDAASTVYVRNKERSATAAGFDSRTIRLATETTQAALLAVIRSLNDDEAIDGILVQLPLPGHIATDAIIRAIDPAKDVDGFHPENVAALALGNPRLVPCTPRGVMLLLAASGIQISGSRAVVLGRSNIVGRPMAGLLLTADATVTIAHSRTRDLPAECRRADILIAAVGRPAMVEGAWVRQGATVIDVGINRTAEGALIGDVDFNAVRTVAGAITPVPGGVGPMTIACLLDNTLIAAAARRAKLSGAANA